MTILYHFCNVTANTQVHDPLPFYNRLIVDPLPFCILHYCIITSVCATLYQLLLLYCSLYRCSPYPSLTPSSPWTGKVAGCGSCRSEGSCRRFVPAFSGRMRAFRKCCYQLQRHSKHSISMSPRWLVRNENSS